MLRKQPPGRLLPSAHAVDREYRVLAALKDTTVAVPKVLHLCTDASKLGAKFYIMTFVNGHLHLNPTLPDLTSEARQRTYSAMAGALVLDLILWTLVHAC